MRRQVRGPQVRQSERVRSLFLTVKLQAGQPLILATKWTTQRRTETYVNYLLAQREMSKTGYEHCHIYVQFKTQVRVSTLKSKFLCGQHNEAHFENIISTVENVQKYVSKEDTRMPGPFQISIDGEIGDRTNPFSMGTPRMKEVRNTKKNSAYKDLVHRVYDLNETMEDVVDSNPAIAGMHYQKLKFLQQVAMKKQARIAAQQKFTIELWCGDSGTGKTLGVQNYEWTTFKNSEFFVIKKCHDGKEWWSLYDKQPVVIVEEYDPTWFSTDTILGFVDQTARMAGVPTKGGHTYCIATRMYLLSNLWPDEIFNKVPLHQLTPLKRRIDSIKEFHATDDLKDFYNRVDIKIETRTVSTRDVNAAVEEYKKTLAEIIARHTRNPQEDSQDISSPSADEESEDRE